MVARGGDALVRQVDELNRGVAGDEQVGDGVGGVVGAAVVEDQQHVAGEELREGGVDGGAEGGGGLPGGEEEGEGGHGYWAASRMRSSSMTTFKPASWRSRAKESSW